MHLARLMKQDHDAHFQQTNTAGVTVNRWPTTSMFCSSAASNETSLLDHKFACALGIVALENRPDSATARRSPRWRPALSAAR